MRKEAALRRVISALLLSVMAATSASAGQGPPREEAQAPARSPPEAVPPETFAYLPANDVNLRVTINNVVLRGDPEFIPRADNWIQINMTIANVGRRTLTVNSVQGRLASGALFAAAQAYDNILREPSVNQMMVSNSAAAVGGMAAGYLIFPPAAVLVGAANLVGGMINRGRRERRQRHYSETVLTPGPLAPGTNMSGNVYLPAIRGQTGLLIFYVAAGSDESLEVRRAPSAPTLAGSGAAH